jgi:hypothetical protein
MSPTKKKWEDNGTTGFKPITQKDLVKQQQCQAEWKVKTSAIAKAHVNRA